MTKVSNFCSNTKYCPQRWRQFNKLKRLFQPQFYGQNAHQYSMMSISKVAISRFRTRVPGSYPQAQWDSGAFADGLDYAVLNND